MIGALARPARMNTGPDVLRRRVDQRLHRDFIRRRDHDEARQRAREADLLDAHLRRPVLADRDAAVRARPPSRSCSDTRPRRAAARSLCSARTRRSWPRTESCPRTPGPQPIADHVRFRDTAFERSGQGILSRNRWSYVDFERSASSTTMSLFSRPSSTSAFRTPRASPRPSFSSYLVLVPALLQLLQCQLRLRPASAPRRGTWDCSP